MVQNHEHMSALYYAVMMAGVVPFLMAPGSAKEELRHFIPLVSPRLIFCEPERRDDVIKALRSCDVRATVVAADEASLSDFVRGHSDDIDSFQDRVGVDSAVLMLPTSGSIGLPKVAVLNQQGLVMQIATQWQHHSKFPQPTGLLMLLATPQWITHTMSMCNCVVVQVPILMSPVKLTAERMMHVVETYRPTWMMLSPSSAMHFGTPEQLSSLNTIYVAGSFFTPENVATLKNKLPASANVLNAYGMTEAHGAVAMGKSGTPLTTPGTVGNIFEYRLINSFGEEVLKPYEKGELYLKGKCILQGYLNNEAAYQESVTPDGWLKTGDIFYKDEDEHIYFTNRSKLGFKYRMSKNLPTLVYPEEIERVINSIPGIHQCVVCNSFCKENGVDRGPTAAIVLVPGCDVTRERVHQTINSTLSDAYRLRGGIGIVRALPTTANGKLARAACFQLVQQLAADGLCF